MSAVQADKTTVSVSHEKRSYEKADNSIVHKKSLPPPTLNHVVKT